MTAVRSIKATSGVLVILLFLCQGQGCPSGTILPFVPEELLDDTNFDLGAANTVTVEAGTVGTAQTAVSVDDDFSDEADDVFFTLDASEISVSFDEDAQRRNPAAKAVERFAKITLRLAMSGDEPCDSDAQVGPFELTIANGEVTLLNDALPVEGAARDIVTAGDFEVCVEVWADFHGSVSCGEVGVRRHRGRGPRDDGDDGYDEDHGDNDKVVICHIPPGNPDRQHTITVSQAAIEAHLAHGDRLGACDGDEGEVEDGDTDSDDDGVNDPDDVCPDTPADEAIDTDGCSCSQKDTDGDGVNDCDDQCPDTADGVETDTDGCSCVQLENCDDETDDVLTPADECLVDTDCADDTGCTDLMCVDGYCALQVPDQVRFVDGGAVGVNDGSSWDNAYVDLQDALTEAGVNTGITEIWVAANGGVPYTPAGPGGSRSDSFELMNCLGIYGGFVGGEAFRGQRDPNVNVTILSADLNDDDNAGGSIDENSYHVVESGYHLRLVGQWADATAVIDGFKLTGGNANGGLPENYGGGMYNHGGSPTVRNCVFVDNSAVYGGGMHNHNAINVPTVTDCLFINNAAQRGGGLANSNGTPRLVRCRFVGNEATVRGGGIYSTGIGDNTPTLTDCLLSHNKAAGDGGAIYSYMLAPTIRNVTFVSNSSGTVGGGMYIFFADNALLTDRDLTITNCIFWNNDDSSGVTETAQIHTLDADPVVSYTLIEGLDFYATGTGNIGGDPSFVGTDDLRLGADSPAIDAGDPGTVLEADETDLDGEVRIQSNRVDMGAYEFGAG